MATVGRKPRRPKNPSGPVRTRGHTRSPRGPNRGKRKVSVRPYHRGRPSRRRR